MEYTTLLIHDHHGAIGIILILQLCNASLSVAIRTANLIYHWISGFPHKQPSSIP